MAINRGAHQGLQPGTQFRARKAASLFVTGDAEHLVPAIPHGAGTARPEVHAAALSLAHPQDLLR